MTKEQLILQSSLEACRQRTEKLRYSIDKNAHLFPITMAQLAAFNDEQEESVDALILRYSQCVTMIQEQLFRGIAFLEQEDISDKSNRDKTLLMESSAPSSPPKPLAQRPCCATSFLITTPRRAPRASKSLIWSWKKPVSS